MLRALAERFGPDVVGTNGADRARIAEIVFNEPEQLAWLEELLHPRVVQANLDWRAEQESRSERPLLTVT